ncbi:MAG: ATP-binding protein [Xanthomonadales bacterium]|nr:ATP-binding protein [Xanthomonadales bacterium]
MLQVSDSEINQRLREENPWWAAGAGIDGGHADYPRRAYLGPFYRLIRADDPQRALLLLGPRRVGKTIMVFHAIDRLLAEGVPGRDILYVSLETPTYFNQGLDSLLRRFSGLFERPAGTPLYVFFDEIQYLKGWEVHLKSLVDSQRSARIVATGSAAAALKHKSVESGAGRFTEFVLPPLTFFEYLRFLGAEDDLIIEDEDRTDASRFRARDIHALNDAFVAYVNFGGYPEAVFSEAVRRNARRYIKSDIIDKVLLRDLPSLYGISDVQELNSLFNTLAYNSAQEISVEALAHSSGVSKPTIAKYLEYLEAAFLIKRLRRVDENAARFRKAMTFKVYLTNPTMRAALFAPLKADDAALGHLVETAVFSQWLHNADYIDSLHYARWKKGEVDLVSLDARQRPRFAVEVKWSDRAASDAKEIRALLDFARTNPLQRRPLVTTRTASALQEWDGISVEFTPAALHCYTVGRNTLERSR